MAVKVIRGIFVLACAALGMIWAYYFTMSPAGAEGTQFTPPSLPMMVLGALAGAGIAISVMLLLALVTQDIFEKVSPALVAIALGLITGYVVGQAIAEWYLPNADVSLRLYIMTTMIFLFGFIGVFLGLTRASNWESLVRAVHHRSSNGMQQKIIDTSVIIDGRIADIVDTGFVEGELLVPRFVLHELQNIADSADDLRRARGRRGLDILQALQECSRVAGVRVIEDDPPNIHEVDGKLVKVAHDYGAKILTNDLNLNKVAQIEGVEVLNINDLANALKPAVLPDEAMDVKIVKQGKEALQGVGYLDDGTMVVVDGGRNFVGRDVSVHVTSVLQTSAGRMIFARLQNNGQA